MKPLSAVAEIAAAVEERRRPYIEIADRIWGLAEMRYREFESAELHAAALEAEGFRVTRGVAGMPTAFVAEAGSGGPVIGFLGEYDALAGLNQASGALECRPDPERAFNQGHGCGHHLLGTAAHLAAGVARDHLRRHELPGTVRFYGCPAEEAAAGKTFMARAGLFDDLDAALSWHPSVANSVFMNATLANVQAYFRFHGKSAHAALAPHLGRSALDAAELMNVGVNYLREHMPSDNRVHYAVTNTGGISPNVVQANAEVLYLVRAPNVVQARALYERVCKVARGAAMMTETELTIEVDKACSDTLPNATLELTLFENLKAMGPVQFDDADRAFAEQIRASFTEEHIRSSIDTYGADVPLTMPLHDGLVPFDGTALARSGSTDVGDVSWITPTAQVYGACWAIGTPGHSWQVVAQGKSPAAHKAMLHAAQSIAATALDAILTPGLIDRAKAERHEKTGGKPYLCPIPADVVPPSQRR